MPGPSREGPEGPSRTPVVIYQFHIFSRYVSRILSACLSDITMRRIVAPREACFSGFEYLPPINLILSSSDLRRLLLRPSDGDAYRMDGQVEATSLP